jgi:hypothetical protein
MTNIQQVLAEMIPSSLDDIVRKNRDQVQIGLATIEEIAAREGAIEPGPALDTIDEWRVVAIRQLGSQPMLSLLGRVVGTGVRRMTSRIAVLDVARGLCRTRNSLYPLGFPGEGEPPPEDLICVCAILHRWGVGRLIGAPEFFY